MRLAQLAMRVRQKERVNEKAAAVHAVIPSLRSRLRGKVSDTRTCTTSTPRVHRQTQTRTGSGVRLI